MTREKRRAGAGQDQIARLLRAVPQPEEAPSEVRQRVHRAVREEWRGLLRHRRRRRWQLTLAAAALALAIVGVWIASGPWRPGTASSTVVATVEAMSGSVAVAGEALRFGEELMADAVVATTPSGRAALRLAGGQSLRLDVDSRVRLSSDRELHLERGALYLDSAGVDADELAVHTGFGVVRNLGTQFEVRLAQDALRVRVREGRVRVEQGRRRLEAGVGDELVLARDGAVRRAAIALHGAPWSWNLEIAPRFDLEGRKLREFLDWASRETGWRLEYADPGLERRAREITLHGDLRGLTPDVALPVILQSSGLSHQRTDGVVRIEEGGVR
ncbi:MAG: FecR family protein [Acidobacteriota bacterium]